MEEKKEGRKEEGRRKEGGRKGGRKEGVKEEGRERRSKEKGPQQTKQINTFFNVQENIEVKIWIKVTSTIDIKNNNIRHIHFHRYDE